MRALVDRIRAQRGHMPRRHLVTGAHALVARWAGGPRGGKRRWTWWAVAPAAALLGVVPLVWMLAHDAPRPIALVVTGGRLAPGGAVQPESAEGAKLEFSDGTEIALSPGARTQVRSIDRHGARVVVSAGAAHVDVAHAPGARWLVDAGPFTIRVTGTAFTVAWSPESERLDVDMERGAVEIDGPLSDRAIPLRSGEHLTVNVREGETVLRERGKAPETTTAALPAASAAPLPPAPPPASERPEAAGGKRNSGGADRTDRRWAAALAQGRFETIVGAAERIGIDACLADANASDLGALADAARYARRTDVARRALAALRGRFPDTPAARDAAFLLGRLEETAGAPARACEWYDRYLSESPTGTYASEALGRDMDLLQATYGDGRAESIAEEYLRRFPEGTYAARARAIAHRR